MDRQIAIMPPILYAINARLRFFRQIYQEHQRRHRGKPFEICNDEIWETIRSLRNGIIIELYSFANMLNSPKGYLSALYDRVGISFDLSASMPHNSLIITNFPKGYTPPLDEIQANRKRIMDSGHLDFDKREDAFYRLFPNVSRAEVVSFAEADLILLRDTITEKIAALKDERNFQGHPHEKPYVGGSLQIEDIENVIDFLNRVAMDILTLVYDDTRTYADTYIGCQESAEELVDMLLFKTHWHMQLNWEAMGLSFHPGNRDRFYDRLHSTHDALVRHGRKDLHFNGRETLEALKP